MKKLLFSLLSLFFITAVAFSQDDPKKALNKASRALSAYNLNPTDNDQKLKEAKEMIESAISSADIAGQAKAWQTRGEIYNAYSDKDITMMTIGDNPDFVPAYIDAPLEAAVSFEKALEVAAKKYETKDALKGLNEAGRKLNQIGNYQIGAKDYAGAFKSLNKVYEANTILVEKGGEAVIQPDEINNQIFVMAYCAQASNNKKEATRLFLELYEAGTEEPSVYASLFPLLKDDDNEKAVKIIKEGMEKFPDNTEILFAYINYLIETGNITELEAALKKAIAAEPDNPSVRSALGNVYMGLFTEEFAKNGESETAKGYFDKSLDYFQQAIDIEPKQFDAIYSKGSLYYNKAVEIVKVANSLGMSQEEVKKYNAMIKESQELMNTALPYFQKAESINANDINTLIALSEIYARMDDFEKSKEFKTRLETLRSGGTNQNSYFNQ